MLSTTESPIATETINPISAGADASVAEDARQHAGRGRGHRIEITSADLTMYSVITGRAPSFEERERALTWTEMAASAASNGGAFSSAGAALPMHVMRPWHPAALSLRVREIWFNGITLKTARPQFTSWLRRLSGAIQQGKRRVGRVR